MNTASNLSAENNKGLISWFARNSVAANLIMCFIFCAGAISLSNISKEMFPRTESRWINVTVAYPGAAPVEVEKGVVLPIEAALDGLRGIKTISSDAFRDRATVNLEVEPNEDINEIYPFLINHISIFDEYIHYILNIHHILDIHPYIRY